jgi:TatD DNase family protein
MFIDTHCHLDDPALFDRLPYVIGNARRAGVDRFVVPGVGPDGWGKIAALADAREAIFPAFGLHPMHADLYGEAVMTNLARYAMEAVAIGEIGLDYLLPEVPRKLQLTAFRGQLQLAVNMGLPLLIHCRRAFQDLLRIMREEHAEKVGGIMHAFSGSPETARECIRLGFAISVAGPVTYLNAVRPLDLVRSIPLEHLVLETDAPDMPPEPYRGKANEPAYLVETARKVAEIKAVGLTELAEATNRNAERIIRLQGLRPPRF